MRLRTSIASRPNVYAADNIQAAAIDPCSPLASMSARQSQHPDRRTNGSAAAEHPTQSRVQLQSQRPASAAERATSRSERRVPSPREPYTNPAHKRSASGNPRPASRSTEERRTERVTVTTRDKLISRTRSPDRRTSNAASSGERWRSRDAARSRAADAEPRKSKPEEPSGMS